MPCKQCRRDPMPPCCCRSSPHQERNRCHLCQNPPRVHRPRMPAVSCVDFRRPVSEILRSVTHGLPALIASASPRYRAPASDAQPFPFAYDGVSLRVLERGKESGKSEPPSPSSPCPVQHLETAFRTP